MDADVPQICAVDGCLEAAPYRAPMPGGARADFDGPGEWQYFCLAHVREFNARFDYFAGMSADEISAAQGPAAGWETPGRRFADLGGGDVPRWAAMPDPLAGMAATGAATGATSMRGPKRAAPAAPDARFSRAERAALRALALAADADRRMLRQAYTALLRQYHPDRNGGDRTGEGRLRAVVDAYQTLRRHPQFI